MNSKKLGPEFTEKPHLKAIYTSRPLRSLISKSSTINSLSAIYRQGMYCIAFKYKLLTVTYKILYTKFFFRLYINRTRT